MHHSTQVANKLLDLANEVGVSLTPMQLIKLVYLAHGWMLALYGRPLIRDAVQAWKYGPVIPVLYKQLRRFKADAVSGRLAVPDYQDFDAEEEDIIKQTFENYGRKSAAYLSALTHMPGSPWSQIWDPESWAAEIPERIIRDYFSDQAARAE